MLRLRGALLLLVGDQTKRTWEGRRRDAHREFARSLVTVAVIKVEGTMKRGNSNSDRWQDIP